MKMRTSIVQMLLVVLWGAHGLAERPAFHNLRFEENAAGYRDLPVESRLDGLKYIALGDEAFLSLGGQARVRGEAWRNFGFAPENDDEFGLLRLRLHADLWLGPRVRVFVEGKSATATDRDLPGGRRTLDVDELDVQNAFVDVMTSLNAGSMTLRLGRQELSYGAQRLVSPLDWSNTRRTWDGARVILRRDGWRIEGFATRPVTVEKYSFNERDDDQGFYGVHATVKIPEGKMVVDTYLFRHDRDLLDEERYTAGLRLYGACLLTGIEYDVEGGYQFGERDDLDIEAWFVAIEAGYTLADWAMKPRVYLGFDYASGDRDGDDGKTQTFHQMFPLGHAYLGYIDVLGRQNVQSFSQGVSFWPLATRVQVRIDHHVFRRAERSDAAYAVGGGILREADAGTSGDLGSELDVRVTWRMDRPTSMMAGYSRFFAGEFIKQSGPSKDIDFVYASIHYTF
ncbi:MAG TPA: alginate export family protein [Kiritimatiellia bacterium]|nr:alginate export family protein [Kiritimatiellia bacterium]